MPSRDLDFFVIGALKSGTTSLHYSLKEHPRIFVPFEKEVPFFAMEDLYQRGMEWYLNEFFSKASADQLIGTVSPQYMLDTKVPERMYKAVPRAKLIAILRDPIHRARSQYKMKVRAFGERRSFSEALGGRYISAGEYGRVLNEYLKLFPREQLLVLFSQDLSVDPGAIMSRIFSFLGVDNRFMPSSSTRRNTSEGPRLQPARVMANFVHTYSRPIHPLIKSLLPARYIRRLGLWSIMYRSDVKGPEAIDTTLSQEQERDLARRYLDDLQILEPIVGVPAPWRSHLESLADDYRRER